MANGEVSTMTTKAIIDLPYIVSPSLIERAIKIELNIILAATLSLGKNCVSVGFAQSSNFRLAAPISNRLTNLGPTRSGIRLAFRQY